MASPQAEAIKVKLIEFAGNLTGTELPEMRASYETFASVCGTPDGVTWTEAEVGGVPAVWADAAGGATDRVLLYVHGGGYVIGAAKFYRNLTGHLAKAIGCRVLNVDYRLAPEHPHPAPVEDSTAAYKGLLDSGIEPGHIAISGDSAGGGLTVATLLSIRQAGLPQPAAAVPLSPWVDMEATGASITANAERDVLVGADALKGMAEAFLQGQNARDPLAAPLHADLAGVCPLYIQVGGDETLLDDSTRLAERARAAGVDVKIDVFPEMQHVFQMGAGNMPEADDAVARIGAWLEPRLGL
ncbi:MAG: alpha/beta hydrolase fold domain-containing protein [Acidimicrobiia bacterium]|nr:alpha/beta hydrolase fold domain-containing protein [Acidimicrobiia bacterium]